MAQKPSYEELERRVRQLEKREADRLRADRLFHKTGPETAMPPKKGRQQPPLAFSTAEKALMESEARYRGVVEDTPVLICTCLPDGEITFVNKAYCDYFHKSKSDLVGTSFLSLIPEGGRQEVMGNIRALTIGSPIQSHEHPVTAPGGKTVWHRWTNRAIFDARGKLTGYQAIGEDITERKNAQAALKSNRDLLESILSNIQGITYRCKMDRDWTMVYMTDWVSSLTGYPAEDFIQNRTRTFASIIHPDDAQRVHKTVVKAVASHRPWEIKYRIYHRTQGICWVYEKGSAEYRRDGKVQHLDGFIINITDQKKFQQKLHESRDRFQKLFHNHMDAIFILDAAIPPKIIECNKAVTTIFQYREKELLGRTADILHVDGAHFKKFQTARYSAIGQKTFLQDFRFNMRRKDGTIFPSEHMVLALKDDDGTRTGWISMVRDLTEKEKHEVQLRHLQRMESIGNLAGGIAHDFNNILFPIIGLSELLLEDLPVQSPEHDSAAEILKAGKRGADLVQQILAFSRQSEHKVIPVRIQQILKEALKLTRATIPSSINMVNKIQPDCGPVMADPTQIHQVIMNLITNAFHAVSPENGEITIRLKDRFIHPEDLDTPQIPPGRYALLTVSDNGHGIPLELIHKIFEPYFTTKSKGKGTGLGLAVVYGIIKDHKGDITVHSTPGQGSSFTTYFPIMEISTSQGSTPKSTALPLGDETILVVDDEAAVTAIETQILIRLGYHPTFCTDSLEALRLFQTDPSRFDLVITDMTMPNLTGDQLAKKLMEIRPDIPIIICTGFSEGINDEKAERLGVKGLLMKPASPSDMAQMVRTVLDGAQVSGPSPAPRP